MKKTYYVRGVEIGAGKPKVILSILEHTEQSIVEKAHLCATSDADLIEWRIDAFEFFQDWENVYKVLKRIRKIIGNLPLIFTFRSQREGGHAFILPHDYAALNTRAAQSGLVDFVDVEVFSGDDVKALIDQIHRTNSKVIGSYHDFNGTPERYAILEKLKKIQAFDADVVKIALMPKQMSDVLELLWASNEMSVHHATRPLIVISMGALGMISRIAGEFFGSSMTFGALGDVSAPGQLEMNRLGALLEMMHQLKV